MSLDSGHVEYNYYKDKCRGYKKNYHTETQARNAAYMYNQDGIYNRQSVYKCPICKMWHLTTKDGWVMNEKIIEVKNDTPILDPNSFNKFSITDIDIEIIDNNRSHIVIGRGKNISLKKNRNTKYYVKCFLRQIMRGVENE